MQMHMITVDDKIFKHLQKNAEPFVDTPNSVLYKLLLNERYSPETEKKNGPALNLKGLPKALSQPLEVLYEIHHNGLSRQEANRLIAKKHGTAPSKIMDKYCKRLSLKARDVDLMFEEPGYEKFMNLLQEKYPEFGTIIDLFFETLFVEK
jgi:hypothetical protein